MKAFLLAAGLGTRLRPLTFFVPKPLVLVGEATIIDHAIRWLRAQGAEIYVVGFYLQELLREYLREHHPDVVFIPSRKLLGTAGQLYYAKEYLGDEPVLVAPSDVITNLNVGQVLEFHKSSSYKLTIVGQIVETTVRFGVLEVEDNKLKEWKEKPKLVNIVSTGIYIVEGAEVRRLEERYLDFNDFAVSLLPNVAVFLPNAVFYDVGTLDDLKVVSQSYLNKLGH